MKLRTLAKDEVLFEYKRDTYIIFVNSNVTSDNTLRPSSHVMDSNACTCVNHGTFFISFKIDIQHIQDRQAN